MNRMVNAEYLRVRLFATKYLIDQARPLAFQPGISSRIRIPRFLSYLPTLSIRLALKLNLLRHQLRNHPTRPLARRQSAALTKHWHLPAEAASYDAIGT